MSATNTAPATAPALSTASKIPCPDCQRPLAPRSERRHRATCPGKSSTVENRARTAARERLAALEAHLSEPPADPSAVRAWQIRAAEILAEYRILDRVIHGA